LKVKEGLWAREEARTLSRERVLASIRGRGNEEDELSLKRSMVKKGHLLLLAFGEVQIEQPLRRHPLRRRYRRLRPGRRNVFAGERTVVFDKVVRWEVVEVEPATVAPERLEGGDELDGESWGEVCGREGRRTGKVISERRRKRRENDDEL
jgi:hypothetical protein